MWFRPAGAGMADGAAAVGDAAAGDGAAGGFPAPPWSAGCPRVSRWAAMVTATGIRTTPVTDMAASNPPPIAIMAGPPAPRTAGGAAGPSPRLLSPPPVAAPHWVLGAWLRGKP